MVAVLSILAAFAACVGLALNKVVHLDPGTLTLLTGAAVPILTNLITKSSASSKIKGLVMLILSAGAGGLVVASDAGGTVVLGDWIKGMALSFGSAYLSHKALWDRFGVTDFLYNSFLGSKGIGDTKGIVAPGPTAGDAISLGAYTTSANASTGYVTLTGPGGQPPSDTTAGD